MKISSKKSPKKLIIVLPLVAVVAIVGGLLLNSRHTLQDKVMSDNSSAKTTSTVDSAQSDFTSEDTTKDAGGSSGREGANGGIADTNGTSGSSVDTSNATSSSTGKITVYAPARNSLLPNGASVSGASSLSRVSYRIVDTEVGVVSAGSLNVVNGKFSGTIQFQSKAQNGQLDFFGTQSDGNEFDNISILVRFK